MSLEDQRQAAQVKVNFAYGALDVAKKELADIETKIAEQEKHLSLWAEVEVTAAHFGEESKNAFANVIERARGLFN